MKLTQKLTTGQFIITQGALLIFGLIFLGSLYYILNIQYQPPRDRFAQGPVTTPPKSLRVDLDQPDEDALFLQPDIIISGQTGPNLEVLIMMDSSDVVIKAKADGKFSTILKLDEGVNNIRVVVFDSTGDSRTTERMVYYSKEKI